MQIWGIDCSSKNIAISCFDGGNLSWVSYKDSKMKNTQDRIFELGKRFEKALMGGIPDIIFIEESIYVSNFKTSKAIAEVIGNIKWICAENEVKFRTVQNRMWKKEIIGSGGASKEDIKRFVIERYPQLKNESQDVWDSVGVALYGIKYQALLKGSENEARKNV